MRLKYLYLLVMIALLTACGTTTPEEAGGDEAQSNDETTVEAEATEEPTAVP